jgi:hypothetical protein
MQLVNLSLRQAAGGGHRSCGPSRLQSAAGVALFMLLAMATPRDAVRADAPGAQPWSARVHGTRVAHGDGELRAAWLEEPRHDYAHGVFGAIAEAGTLAVLDADHTVHQIVLPAGQVFEDIEPRVVRIDADREAVWTVLSDAHRGAAPVLFVLRDGALRELARGEPIGMRHRWLNPVGAGDLDGDGEVEFAWIRTPHIGGILHVARIDGAVLRTVARFAGVSNHVYGTTEIGLAAIVPGAPPYIVAPTQDRSALLVLHFDGRTIRERRRLELPARQCGDLQRQTGALTVDSCDGTPMRLEIGEIGGGIGDSSLISATSLAMVIGPRRGNK